MRLLIAVAASAAIVLSAPFMGQVRGVLQRAFPGHFAWLIGGVVAVATAIAFAAALTRIRHHRRARLAALAAALAVAVVYTQVMATGVPDVDAVERVHFIEYGVIAFVFYRVWRDAGDSSILVLPLLCALMVGTCDEWLQWFIPNRVGEARDVLLNLVAIGCGLAFAVAVDPPSRFSSRLRSGSPRRVAAITIASLLLFAAFCSTVHLGHLVELEGVGRFKSRYTAAELLQLQADRDARWRTNPPVVLRRLSREDQYMDEGLWHVRRRNLQWSDGNVARAWNENRILETYFAPVLDFPTYASPKGNRWPPPHRADAEARAGSSDTAFISDAEPYPIVRLPQAWLWSIVAAAALAIAIGAVMVERRTAPA